MSAAMVGPAVGVAENHPGIRENELLPTLADVLHELRGIHAALKVLDRAELQSTPMEKQETIGIPAGPSAAGANDPGQIELRALGRKHILMFVVANAQVVFRVPGLGDYSTTLQAGWNIVDLDGALIRAAQGVAAFNAIVRLSSESYGNPI